MEMRAAALRALELNDPVAKAAAVRLLADAKAAPDPGCILQPVASLPGRPERPLLVAPSSLARRSAFTTVGRAALLHAVAHIEFNAINLALDAIWRFPGLPHRYYADWLKVATEESLHFSLLVEHLALLDCRYGDFDAHDGLWTMVERTASDATARMALVPRTLEARGLDATPPMQARLRQAGDDRAADILGVILRDEIGHVAVGNHWYRWLCAQAGLNPLSHYATLSALHGAPRLRPPFNRAARLAAGFDSDEIAALDEPEGVARALHCLPPVTTSPSIP